MLLVSKIKLANYDKESTVAESATSSSQKNSNSIKKMLQLNISVEEIHRQGFGVPSP